MGRFTHGTDRHLGDRSGYQGFFEDLHLVVAFDVKG
jgi:hypothetical protein